MHSQCVGVGSCLLAGSPQPILTTLRPFRTQPVKWWVFLQQSRQDPIYVPTGQHDLDNSSLRLSSYVILSHVNLTVKTQQHAWSTQKPRLHACAIRAPQGWMHCCRSEYELPFAAAEPTMWQENKAGVCACRPQKTSSEELGPPRVCALGAFLVSLGLWQLILGICYP